MHKKKIYRYLSNVFSIVTLLTVAGCTDHLSVPDFYYVNIQNLNLRIPGKYGPIDVTRDRNLQGYCRSHFEECLSKKPGASAESFFFMEQDFKTFERYRMPENFKGLSDNLKLWVKAIDGRNEKVSMPNFPHAWDDQNRNSAKDIYDLKGYGKIDRDDANYFYKFEDSNMLYITCNGFNLPNPGCYATTTWRGLSLNYVFRHRHLSEWRDIHQRITNHLNSFIY